MRKDALDSYRYGCNGLIGIHWRTRDLSPNVSAMAKAAWMADKWATPDTVKIRDLATEDFFTDWIKSEFGIENHKLIDLFVKLDSKGTSQKEGRRGDSPLNASDWTDGPGGMMSNKTREELIERIGRYDFLSEMEKIRSSITGTGNLERFEYWLNSLKFNKAILQTALELKKLQLAVDDIKKETDPAKKHRMATEIALPIRLELAKKWQKMTEVLLAKISTTGEMGMLANLEMHSGRKNQDLIGQDKFLQELGVTIPEEAIPGKAYTGKTRVIVPTDESILSRGKDFYLRIRVLSSAKNISGRLLWRNLGSGKFKSIRLKRMDRNVFDVDIPASDIATDFEYYTEILAGTELVKFPATTPEINRTVVLVK